MPDFLRQRLAAAVLGYPKQSHNGALDHWLLGGLGVGWWGGADAVSAIALNLAWPGTGFFLAFFGCHAVVAFGLMAFTYKAERKFKLHRLPGLPIMLLAVICSQLFPHLMA